MLDSSEVTRAQHVCNGGSGLNALVLISNEPAGVNCANGGKKVDAGQDSNSNGILDPAEITTSAYVCNGINGSNGTNGLNSLMPMVATKSAAGWIATLMAFSIRQKLQQAITYATVRRVQRAQRAQRVQRVRQVPQVQQVQPVPASLG
jgi:hypothetical protein